METNIFASDGKLILITKKYGPYTLEVENLFIKDWNLRVDWSFSHLIDLELKLQSNIPFNIKYRKNGIEIDKEEFLVAEQLYLANKRP